MAQAGLYVPCEKLNFRPFKRLMTRIAGTDNMSRSQSSFQVEMEELLSILNRADEHTLVLGDEICRGTEILSANSIVSTMLKVLSTKKIYFLTATHLHDVAEDVSVLSNISVQHMQTHFTEDGDLVYERKLQDGQGILLYGLEVARALGFPDDFLQYAAEHRKSKIMSKSVRSKYNKKKVLVMCEICKYSPIKENDQHLETHHLNFQCNADETGYHGTQHKDKLHNLVSLCRKCHQNVHKGHVDLKFTQTTRGNLLSVTNLTNIENKI